MTDACLERVNAKKANLSYGLLNKVNFTEADLTKVNLYYAILLDSDLFSFSTFIEEANFEKAVFDEEAKDFFDGSDLTKITFLSKEEAEDAKVGVIEDLFSDYVITELKKWHTANT